METEAPPPLFQQVRERYGNTTAFLAGVEAMLTRQGLTRKALADRAGVNPGQVTRWLNGHNVPTIESMLLIDEAMHQLIFGVPEDY